MSNKVEVMVNWNGTEQKVILKRLTFGEKNDVMRASSKVRIINGQINSDIDPFMLREVCLAKSISEAPFEPTLQNIRNLDAIDGEKLWGECQKLNELGGKKKENSDSQLATEEQ